MPTFRHPLAPRDVDGRPPAEVHISRGESATVQSDGQFEAPEDAGRAIAERHGVSLASMRPADATTDTCDVEKADGEVCGRELPCPYHSDEEDTDA